MPRIPLVDLQAQYQSIKPEIDAAVARVLASGHFILGPEVEALEREVAAYCGTRHAVGVASGTDALVLSLRACGIGPGAEVITTAFSFFATAEAILLAGAAPVFVDIEPATCNLDADQLADAVTSRTKAILPVHLYGHPCAMDRVMDVAQARRLRVIEDCAQAIGATCGGQRVGAFGDAGCLSFYPTKNLGGYGDGGMVVTNDPKLAEHIRLLRAHGSAQRYHHAALGVNSRLDELQAAVLRVKLRHLDRWTEARRRNAEAYRAAFARHSAAGLEGPVERPGCQAVYHLYTIRSPKRDRIHDTLDSESIETQVAYPGTLPSQPALAAIGGRHAPVPRAEEAARQVLSLPVYPELTLDVIDRIAAATARAAR
ncbi:MAG: transcriptional regulator [Candidatus Omnitrophica bacterium CG11_big_fil_rev_8_21_14_0_20_63_9]|nr:MAG: transcriptional regulator [Candidatus Omnitrophica bacterium CG11_big_fil_rev_8_21_14_0_20_63_9]